MEFGSVTAVDLADEVIARARARLPEVNFLAGDFLQLDLPSCNFDVIVSLETIAYVSGQANFIHKAASLLKTGGYLILTTVNKFVFERREDVAPIAPGQIRQWLNTKDVKLLLRPHFSLQRVMTVMPEGHKGTLRLINSHKLNALMQLFFSPATLTRLKEMAGLGQTIVVLARK